MTKKHLLFLFIAPLCCWGETNNTPARNYSMVNFGNEFTSTLLDVGTTSFTFSVEWSPDIETPGKLDLIGKLLSGGTRGWNPLYELDLDLSNREELERVVDGSMDSRFPKEIDIAQRKAIFEVQYNVIVWCYLEPENAYFLEKAFFSVQLPVSPEDWDSIYEDEDNNEKPETPKTSNRLWLYFVLPLGVLCAAAYFMRRKSL